jgi:hypothetical protein
MLHVAFSFMLCACQGQVVRPDANACWVVAAAKQKDCYNTLKDYDIEGNQLPTAIPKTFDLPNGLKSLNGHLCFDPESQEAIEAFRIESNKWIKKHCR